MTAPSITDIRRYQPGGLRLRRGRGHLWDRVAPRGVRVLKKRQEERVVLAGSGRAN
jgi:hypothetical protein